MQRNVISYIDSKNVTLEPSAALLHHVGHKFQEVFQMKHGGYGELSAAKISEMMKANTLDVSLLIVLVKRY